MDVCDSNIDVLTAKPVLYDNKLPHIAEITTLIF